MDEDSNRVDAAASANASSSVFSVTARQRFTVELKPGETTIVSWKKLLKDSKSEPLDSSIQAPSNAHPALEARIAPGQPNKGEEIDAPPANHRFSAVIEKIERLYMGKHSSDEEDMNDVPDDNEYDTEDSFIDDNELDEYFQVDNSAIKHDGFFVNRGRLERIEPPSLPSPSPKKRKRKDLTKSQTEAEKCGLPNKQLKVRKKGAGKSDHLVATDISHLPICAQSSVSCKDLNIQSEIHGSQSCSREKFAGTTTMLDKSTSSKVSNSDVGGSLPEEKKKKDVVKKMGNVMHRHQNNKLKDGKLITNANELDQSSRRKEKDGFCEQPNICVSEIKHPIQTAKSQITLKEASGIKPKISMLDKAIKDLEKLVQESKLSPVEVQDADNVSQAVKRRLPWEVKQKLAKVAKIAQTSQGKISKELIERLMGILGHLVQLRTLKRNLNVMVNSGLSAKKEKDERFHQIKMEVADIIKLQIPYMKNPKALEHQAGSSDDFQETGSLEKEAAQKKYGMNDVLENKLCDIYDLFIEGLELDEDAGPQARKLYTELAKLWPEGFMDNHGIKRAICRAKSRQKALHSGQKEKIKKKKMVTKTEVEEGVKAEIKPVVQSQNGQRKSALAQLSKPIPNAANTSSSIPSQTIITSPGLGLTKQDNKSKDNKNKGDSVNTSDVSRIITDPTVKKKVKRKQQLVPEEAQYLHKKTPPSSNSLVNGEERPKSKKQLVDSPQKPTMKSSPVPAASRTVSELPPKLSSA
ncbi:ubinuclein-1-like isoform X2 [Impatiens glandulifera]|uniref:ubinuclein-1-like isoform X2 n=1 Tax=Impatiens glandulifera TaxID=253017 RepID=UPI001FB15EC4|nr:ubinuclein-1-like isoform X2 [Impatiens glandulifera]